MSAPPGSAASTSIEAGRQISVDSLSNALPPRSRYMQRLALRREADEIRRLIVYGLTLGWILTHMVEEVARHNGQVDILREQIDGLTGE